MSDFSTFGAPQNLVLVEITIYEVIFADHVCEIQISYVPDGKCLTQQALKTKIAALGAGLEKIEEMVVKIAETLQESLSAQWIKVVMRQSPSNNAAMTEATAVIQKKRALSFDFAADEPGMVQ